MKKIFTLVLAVGSITIASAQPGNGSFNNTKQDVKKVNMPQVNQPGFGKSKSNDFDAYSISSREKDAAIKKINREYDQKIAAVKMNRRMRQQEKTREIKMLENKRREEIRQVELRFEKNRRYDQHGNNGHW